MKKEQFWAIAAIISFILAGAEGDQWQMQLVWSSVWMGLMWFSIKQAQRCSK